MSFTPRARLINPRLGTYFAIFASAFAALVLMLLMLEQLGADDGLTRAALLFGMLTMVVGIGLLSFTRDPLEYFASGRRVPAVYCGIGLAISTFGATGIACLTGVLFIIGYDGLWIINGAIAGFVVTAVLLAPFLRKFGTFTIPTYLGRRFDSRMLRIVSAALLAVPTLLMFAAELSMGSRAVAWLSGGGQTLAMLVMVLAVFIGLVLGGMRSLTWSNVATAIVAGAALFVPVAIVAVLLGYLPLPQLSHGPVIRGVGRVEAIQGLPIVAQSFLTLNLPPDAMQPIAKRFSEPFGAISPLAFVLATLTTMAGVAAAPWLLPRMATAPGVYEARKSLGWATFFFGAIMLTCATIAVFMRHYLLDVTGTSLASPPEWLRTLSAEGFAEISTRGTQLAMTSVNFDRDSILLALPMAAGLPMVFAYLAAAGIVAAAFAAATATALTLANLLSEDIVSGLSWKPPGDAFRLGAGRIMLALVMTFGGVVAVVANSDALKLLMWALALTGASAFPVLIASIWWKRINEFGAFAGLVTGFAVGVLIILAGEAGLISVSSALAAVLALPSSVLAMVVVSLTTTPPSRHVMELVLDLRVPGGELLYDREMRIMKQKERKRH
ncbi:Sodium:solute symporter [Candidatus Filomicrobium marinum]|uniref:Sodium:solute symporter n=1 Tax=Candidatus Filomicrobium marinum TaxID=1608628 RepID=A0A0D6JFD9_9HYPH|nr:sodium:solute symporter [Candidatus Filomicrobium marinum]CFX20156.1 Sodium:solute symporter [Candidatus Filomicrobium marinum]CPR18611.1 Sodium:solute symporter [Candidatus Filomicrobium marinum]